MYRFSKFLLSMFKIGCIGFGGGSALIPVIEREFIGDEKLDTKENYNKDILIASLTPGALPGSILCKALTAIGYYYGISVTGSTLGGFLFALGGFACCIAVSCMVFGIIYHLYERFSNFRSMKTISHYIGPIICGLLGTVILALFVSIKELL